MTDKVKMYAVKNENGEWFDFYDEKFWPSEACIWTTTGNHEYANRIAFERGGHVVALVEKPEPEVVSEKEASLLEKMADGTNFNGERGFEPGLVITNFVLNNPVHGESHFETEDRLMRAYVNGWTEEKPKRYGVWVPHVVGKMYFKDGRGNDGLDVADADFLNDSNQQFTLAEIEHYGLQDCEKVEVRDE